MKVKTAAMDLSKNIFHAHGADRGGRAASGQALRRSRFQEASSLSDRLGGLRRLPLLGGGQLKGRACALLPESLFISGIFSRSAGCRRIKGEAVSAPGQRESGGSAPGKSP